MQIVFLSALFINIVAVTYSVVENRALLSEGSWFVYRNLQYFETSTGGNHKRYLAGLWETPNLVFAKISMIFDLELTHFITTFWSALISILPVVSLYLIYRYLKAKGQTSFMAFPLISYGAATLVAIVYAANPLFEVHILFWSIGVLCAFSEFSSKRFWIVFPILLLAFSSSHETAFLLCLPLLCGVFARLRLKKFDFQTGMVLFSILLSSAVSLFRSQTGAYTTQSSFVEATLSGWMYFLPQITIVLLTLIAVTVRFTKLRNFIVVSILLLTISIFIWSHYTSDISLVRVYLTTGRGMSLLVAAHVFMIFIFAKHFQIKENFRALAFIAGLSVILGSALDVKITRAWVQGKKNLYALKEDLGKGCHVIDYSTFQQTLEPYGLEDKQLSVQSMLLEKKKTISSIIFVDNSTSQNFVLPKDACDTVAKSKTFYFFGQQHFFPLKYFGYSFLDKSN